MIEPTFTLKATDPAASTALRAYIDCVKRQGGSHQRGLELNDILLSFSIYNRQPSMTRTLPPIVPQVDRLSPLADPTMVVGPKQKGRK